MSSLPASDSNVPSAPSDGPPAPKRKQTMKPSAQKRIESFRLAKSREFQAKLHREAFEETTVDLDTLMAAIKQLDINKAKQTSSVPVTTRGVGFSVQESYNRAVEQVPRAREVCDVHTLYRVSLAQHQLQLSRSQAEHDLLDPLAPPSDLSLEPSLVQEVEGMPQNFAITADLINATGVVELQQQQFAPFVPELFVDSEMAPPVGSTPKRKRASSIRRVSDPYTITFNGLREVLTALANPDTPQIEREYFINNNSLPNAIFENGVLVNADQIMPVGYGRVHLKRDLRSAASFFGMMGSKLSTIVGTCTFSGRGSQSQLAGYYKEHFKLDEIDLDSPPYSRLRVCRPIEQSFLVRAALNMLGEYPVDGLPRDLRQFAMREPFNQVEYSDIDRSGLVTRCFLAKR